MNSEHGHHREPEAKFTAGFNLLDRFQIQWQLIHSKSIDNLSKAKYALSEIKALDKSVSKMADALDELSNSYKSFDQMNKQILNIGNDLQNLELSIRNIEDLLIIAKGHKEELEHRRVMNELDTTLEERTKELHNSSNKRRNQLKLDHNKRIADLERKYENELEERRFVLERAFEEEKQKYLEQKTYETSDTSGR